MEEVMIELAEATMVTSPRSAAEDYASNRAAREISARPTMKAGTVWIRKY
jgi:hypothetical protein